MELRKLIIEMKLLENRLRPYEEKYNVLSEDFYAALMSGKVDDHDAPDEVRTEFSGWKGVYEAWRRRKDAYRKLLQERDITKILRFRQEKVIARNRYTRITLNSDTNGKPYIRDLNITVGTIIGWLASGRTTAEILKAHPRLKNEDIQEALAYAAWRADEPEALVEN